MQVSTNDQCETTQPFSSQCLVLPKVRYGQINEHNEQMSFQVSFASSAEKAGQIPQTTLCEEDLRLVAGLCVTASRSTAITRNGTSLAD